MHSESALAGCQPVRRCRVSAHSFRSSLNFCVASPPSPRRASAATSHSSRTGGRRCVLCSVHIACFALSLSLLQHVAAILGSRSSRCSRSSYRFSLTACYHLRLRPNSMLITQKPNIPEVFRPPSLFPVDPPQGGATAISHGAHPASPDTAPQ